jgi:hypothetical protein
MSSKDKVMVFKIAETDFEVLLRRSSDLLRKRQNDRRAAKPIAVTKKHSSAA